jgi:transcription factor TFIIIB component B''
MAHYFPTRTKTQVKKKGLRENKSNPDRVTRAILSRGTIGESALGWRSHAVARDSSLPDEGLVSVCDRTVTDHLSDPAYLIKTIGYDPRRPFDREQELFAEAKADMERLKKLDSMVPEGEGGEEEGHEQEDEVVERDGEEDEAVEEEHEDGKEGEDEGEVGEEWE